MANIVPMWARSCNNFSYFRVVIDTLADVCDEVVMNMSSEGLRIIDLMSAPMRSFVVEIALEETVSALCAIDCRAAVAIDALEDTVVGVDVFSNADANAREATMTALGCIPMLIS